MSRVFAIGDIHGCINTFRKMVLEEIKLKKSDVLYCLGDYVDRGPDSKAVIDFILELRSKKYTVHTLRGNHEQIMMDSIISNQAFYLWADNGGLETLKSFGGSTYDDLAPEYKSFFEETEFFCLHDQWIFVHAGLNFDAPDPFDDKRSMLWIRGKPVNYEILGNRTLVHGHTPMPLERILAQTDGNVFNIDGGCVYKRVDGLGNLIGLSLTHRTLIVVPNID